MLERVRAPRVCCHSDALCYVSSSEMILLLTLVVIAFGGPSLTAVEQCVGTGVKQGKEAYDGVVSPIVRDVPTHARMTGTYHRIAPHGVTSIAHEALQEYYQIYGIRLQMVRVLEAKRQLVNGLKYVLNIQIQEGIINVVVLQRGGTRQYAFPDTELPRFVPARDSSLLATWTEYFRLRPRDEFHLATRFPSCASVIERSIDQGVCGSCAVIATLTAFRDLHCIASGDTLSHLHLDVARTMTCASLEDASHKMYGSNTPYRSMICEGSSVLEIVDHLRENGLAYVQKDTNELFSSSPHKTTQGIFHVDTSVACPRPLRLECRSPNASIQASFASLQSKFILKDKHAHLSYCKPEHQSEDYRCITSTSMHDLSASTNCYESLVPDTLKQVQGSITLSITVEQMKYALRSGPLIIEVDWYESFHHDQAKCELPDPHGPRTRLIDHDTARQWTEQQLTQCRKDKNCDYVLGRHSIVFVGWTEGYWIARNSHGTSGSSTRMLFSQHQTKWIVKEANMPYLDASSVCSRVLPIFILNEEQVPSTDEISPLSVGHINDLTDMYHVRQQGYKLEITWFNPQTRRTVFVTLRHGQIQLISSGACIVSIECTSVPVPTPAIQSFFSSLLAWWRS